VHKTGLQADLRSHPAIGETGMLAARTVAVTPDVRAVAGAIYSDAEG
jgi:hypothetical protein